MTLVHFLLCIKVVENKPIRLIMLSRRKPILGFKKVTTKPSWHFLKTKTGTPMPVKPKVNCDSKDAHFKDWLLSLIKAQINDTDVVYLSTKIRINLDL